MKNSRILFFLLIGLMLGMSSCREDEDRIIEIPRTMDFGIPFDGAVSGQVMNDRGFPISDAMVSMQGISILTDQNGSYAFTDMQLMENQRVVIKVSAPDYFETSRAFIASRNRSIETFELISKRDITSIINSMEENNIQARKNNLISYINIPANAFVLDGTDIPYQGNVKVSKVPIDPADRNGLNSIPGDLGGIDANGEEVQLASYSMLGVELETENGEKLNLVPGVEATIKFAIPEEFAPSAPSNIPLWYYDLENGYWKEEGTANLSPDGTFYEGKVKHFSYWNCDIPFPLINLFGRVVNENGLPISDLTVRATILNGALTRYAKTDSDGKFGGNIPKGETLKLEFIRNYPCDEIIEEIEVGPFDNDVVLEDHIFSIPEEGYNLLSGKVLGCDGLPSPTSFVYVITFGTKIANLIPDNNGNFNYAVPNCISDITLFTSDFVNGYTTEPLFLQNEPDKDIIIPDILLCDENISFIQFTYEGSIYRKDFFTSDFTGNGDYFFTANIDSLGLSGISVGITLSDIDPTGIEVGEYVSDRVLISFQDENEADHSFWCTGNQDTCKINISIESVGDIGEYINGSFSGSVTDTHPDFPGLREVTGTFSSLRQN